MKKMMSALVIGLFLVSATSHAVEQDKTKTTTTTLSAPAAVETAPQVQPKVAPKEVTKPEEKVVAANTKPEGEAKTVADESAIQVTAPKEDAAKIEKEKIEKKDKTTEAEVTK